MQLLFPGPAVALPSQYTITLAQPEHLSVLAEIENRAAVLFEGFVPDEISEVTVATSEILAGLLGGHLWVALFEGIPVGFALVRLLNSEHPHLEELDVLPEHGRRGLGTALLRTVQSWSARQGYSKLTLTTFRDVPWNKPFYLRRGFEEVPGSEMEPELTEVVARETKRGLNPELRVAMRYRIWGNEKLIWRKGN